MGLSSALLCLSVGASALSLQRAPLRTAKRAPARGRVTMEDFGLMAGTQFSFRDEWRVDANSGRMMDCISEVKIERYMNYHGRRHKMNKTAQERKDNNLKLGGGFFPEFSFTIPFLNVVVNIGPPETESIWEALGFTASGCVELPYETGDALKKPDASKAAGRQLARA